MKTTARIAAMVGIACLTLAGCGDRPSDEADETPTTSATESESPSEPAQQHPDFKACMVSDSGGFDDKSFNQTSHDGLVDAKTDLGVQTAEVESNAVSEFKDNINELVTQKCDIVNTVGFLLAADTLAAAKKNPKIDFAIVDNAYIDPRRARTRSQEPQGADVQHRPAPFLAGYLAAAKSETGIVGTFGGVNIPSVTIFMTGFANGVAKYNEDNGRRRQGHRLGPGDPEGLLHQRLREQEPRKVDRRGDDHAGRRHHPSGGRPGRARRAARPPRTTTSRRSGSTPTAVSRRRSTATCC